MKDHLIFDTTDVVTMQDTDSVGAYVRADKSGALITHHAMQKPSSGSFSFVDGDVTPGSDTINETAHGFQTGDKLQLTTTGVLPAGLALATDYYLIRVDADNFKLASSQYNAEWNIPVDITAAAGGGTHTLTGVEVEARALDVWMTNPSMVISDGGGSITVDAVNLDIRDLVFATDKVDVSGSTVELGATTLAALENITVSVSGTVAVTQSTSPWIVDTGLSYLEDSAHVSGDKGIMALAVRNDVEGSLVSADGDYGALQLDALGRLRVAADISVVTGHEKAEDAASADGDIGSYVLAVRQDVLAISTSADGDYTSFKTNDKGALYVDIASSSGTLTVSDAALANTAIANAANPLNVAGTAEAAVGSALANRKYLWIYNNDNTKVYIGGASVSAANGFPVSPGSYLEMRAGAAVSPFFVGQAGKTPEIRTLELS